MEPKLLQKTYQLQNSHWWFVSQNFLIMHFLKRFLSQKKHKIKILDVGCGAGVSLRLLKEYGWRVGVDYDSSAINICSRDLDNILCQASISSLPFNDKTFDVVTVLGVLNQRNVKDDFCGIKEVYRVLQEQGSVIFSEPAFNILMREHDIVEHTLRRYRINDFKLKIERANFKIKEIFYAYSFLFLPILMVKFKNKFLKCKDESASDLFAIPPHLNKIMILFSRIEMAVLRILKIPFGICVICVAEK